VSLVTSGVPLDQARLARLAPSLDHVQLSVQDAEAEPSDIIAGFRSFAQKLEVAGWVKAAGLPLTLNVVLHRQNLDHVPALVALGEQLGAERLELANTQYLGWALANRAALLPSRAALERARAQGCDEMVGLLLEERGMLRNHQPVLAEAQAETHGTRIGEITSGTFSPTLNRAIALARVRRDTPARVWVEIRGQPHAARVVKPPFVRNGKVLIEL